MHLQIDLRYQIDSCGADFLFNIHAAHTRNQVVSAESLLLNQASNPVVNTDPSSGNRCMRLRAEPGQLHLTYMATVELIHHIADPLSIPEVPVNMLPAEALPYLYPSRYCQSDRWLRFAANTFGSLSRGDGRVQAICDWVKAHVTLPSSSTNSNTSAVDTLVQQVGMCRDFAHLMIGLCRANNIPARFVTGTDYGFEASYGPPGFHAYVEAYLGDRWYLFDPSGLTVPMGLIRIATGREGLKGICRSN
mgnify:CR=1 FL=1